MSGDPRLTPARGDLAADYLRSIVKADRYAKGEARRVILSPCPLFDAPDPAAQRVTELLHGEDFIVYEDKDYFSWGQAVSDQYVGYAPTHLLGPIEEEPTHKVQALRTPAYRNADIKSPLVTTLSFGASLLARTDAGYVFAEHLVPIDSFEPDYVTTAVRFIGVPYLWGGRTSLGLDCSALVQLALEAAGITCPRDTDMQKDAVGEPVDLNAGQAEPGDLVFFPGHVGILLDEQTLLHANAWDMMVSPHPLRYVIAEVAKKHEQPITAIKRINL